MAGAEMVQGSRHGQHGRYAATGEGNKGAPIGGARAEERPFDFGASQKDDTLIREMQQQPLRPKQPQQHNQQYQHEQLQAYQQEQEQEQELNQPPPAQRPPRIPYVSAFGKGHFVPDRPAVEERPAKVLEVVRGKAAREALPGYTCPECVKFFECMIEQGIYTREELPTVLRDCSRHKGEHAPSDTPEEVWGLSVRTPEAWRAQDVRRGGDKHED